jgi:plastocyanin
MHLLALQLAPVLAAEKSKTAFYILGGVLVGWALILSLAIGMRRPRFPGNLQGQRIVMAISAALVLGTIATAVITSSPPAKAGEQTPGGQPTSGPPPAGSSAPTPTTSSGAAPSSSGGSGTAGGSSAAGATGASAGGATSALKLAASPGGALSFDTKQLSAKTGTVTVTFANSSPIEHNVTIAQGATVLGATPTFTGGTRTLTLKLKPGTYTFYCSVPGHRAAGMEGTLSVS